MSQPADRIIQVEDMGDERIDTTGNPDVPPSEQHQSSWSQPTFSDGSEPIFNMYVKMSQEEDDKMANRWQKDADGILIFTGLFSASVAALLAVSIQDLRPNSQDTSAFYLANIYLLLADPNISRASILASPATPPPFSPPRYAIWVNSLWFLSLVISLTSALLATLLQQWARRYLTITQPPRLSPHKRARIRSFFADGVEKFHLPLAVETLPALLHVSLFLFFSGLLVFLFNINHTTFSIPLLCPLTSSAWFLLNGVQYQVFRILAFVTPFCDFTAATWWLFHDMRETYRERTSWGIVKAAQESPSKMSAEIDNRVLKWTFEALDEDRELEQFFEGIPAFCTSQVVHEPRHILAQLNVKVFAAACDGFLIRTFSSHSLSERIKERRFILCMQAMDALNSSLFPPYGFFSQVFGPPAIDGVLQSVPIGQLLRSRCHSSKGISALYAQTLVAGIIASVPERNGRWKLLVMDQLQISKDVLEEYLAQGDSVLLANWIQFFRVYLEHPWNSVSNEIWQITLIISKFDIRNTLPRLQHDFCALWNQLLNSRSYTDSVLRPNWDLFIALHPVPTAFDPFNSDPFLGQTFYFPMCNVPGHHSDDVTDEITHSLIHSSPVHPPDADLNNIALAVPEIPSLPADHSHINLTEQSSPHGVPHATPIIQSSHLPPPANVGNIDFAITVPDPALTIETATSIAISPSLPSSRGAVDWQYKTDLDVDSPSMVPGIPSSSSPVPASSDARPPDPLMSLARSPTSQIELITPGSRFLMQGSVPEISFTPPQMASGSQSNLSENDGMFDTHDNSLLTHPEDLVDTTPPYDDRPE
ncbi:hypothetical protein BGW80DRAFT_1513149 [Lactifluus volemus]|nr:hypothetical protein BGW80DRAFT_1513149 [Lactifluus volemus]